MRVQTEVTVLFESQEFSLLNRMEPCIRVGYPTDEIEQAVREEREGDKRNRVKQTRNEYAGKHILAVCSRRDVFGAEWIHAAWDELSHVIAVLGEQSTREYWERELHLQPTQPVAYADVVRDGPRGTPGGGLSLVAPGTDICGMLAETRQSMLRCAKDAAPVLRAAVKAVGPITERLTYADLKVEGI